MKKIYVLILILIVAKSWAQAPTFAWAKAMGSSLNDNGLSVKTDASGNVYTAGYFSGTVDFDPGPGTYTLTSAGGYDMFIQKLDAAGNFVWTKSVGAAASDVGYGITIDGSGNIYIAGHFESTVDFNPGPGTFNLTSAGIDDIFILKLDASGNFVWANRMGSTSNDVPYSITSDGSGNVYTTGYFIGTVDFDPGAGTYTLASAGGGYDIFIHKLDASGNFLWARSMGNTGTDYGQSIVSDAAGNVYTTGYFNGTVDFDPGAGTSNLISGGGPDAFVQKLDASGNFVWAKSAGSSSNDYGYAIAMDGSGNVYVTGSFIGTVDFDPGPGTFTLTSAGSNEIYIQKLDAGGNFVWAKKIGSTSSDVGNGITTDSFGDVYVAGEFTGTVDFDPGVGTYTIASVGSIDIFILKLDAGGNFLWSVAMGSTIGDRAQAINVDGSGIIYTTGVFYGTADFDIGPGVFNMTSLGNGDIFVHKLLPCASAPAQPLAISGATFVCSGSGAGNYSIAAVAGATSYTWNLPGGWSGSSSTNTISATPGSTGLFAVAAINACGTSSQQTLNVTVSPCTGMGQMINSVSELNIYPNPFNNKITVVSGGIKQSIQIFNVLGTLLYNSTIEDSKAEIELSQQPSGIYFIKIGSEIKKVIKE
jgi:hypothetical protein